MGIQLDPRYWISVLCFHVLVFMDVRAALCSGAVLSVNIQKNVNAMQIMSDIDILLLLQDNADSCKSHSTWNTKFDAYRRTICLHRGNILDPVHVSELDFRKQEALIKPA